MTAKPLHMTRCVIVRVYCRLVLLVSRPGLTQLARETGRVMLVLAQIKPRASLRLGLEPVHNLPSVCF